MTITTFINSPYEAVMMKREKLLYPEYSDPKNGSPNAAAAIRPQALEQLQKLLYPEYSDPKNGSPNAAAAIRPQALEQLQVLEQQQNQACDSRENIRRKDLLLLIKKGR